MPEPIISTDQPQNGDIVVTRPSAAVVSYSVRQLAGQVQFTASSRDEAVRLARGLAQRESVYLWYCEERKCLLLECYGTRARSAAVRARVA
jgi:hypothetical protein